MCNGVNNGTHGSTSDNSWSDLIAKITKRIKFWKNYQKNNGKILKERCGVVPYTVHHC